MFLKGSATPLSEKSELTGRRIKLKMTGHQISRAFIFFKEVMTFSPTSFFSDAHTCSIVVNDQLFKVYPEKYGLRF